MKKSCGGGWQMPKTQRGSAGNVVVVVVVADAAVVAASVEQIRGN